MSEEEETPETKAGISCSEAGRRGGKATKEKYGTDFFQKAGQKGGSTTRDRHGAEHYENIGRMGGMKLKESREEGYFQEIGRKGGKRVSDAFKALKAQEKEQETEGTDSLEEKEGTK